jgi:hypothetical protein
MIRLRDCQRAPDGQSGGDGALLGSRPEADSLELWSRTQQSRPRHHFILHLQDSASASAGSPYSLIENAIEFEANSRSLLTAHGDRRAGEAPETIP